MCVQKYPGKMSYKVGTSLAYLFFIPSLPHTLDVLPVCYFNGSVSTIHVELSNLFLIKNEALLYVSHTSSAVDFVRGLIG